MRSTKRFLGLLFLAVTPGLAQVRPNILWLVAEDMSPLLGSYGVSEAKTPNLDKLAKDGIRYTRAFVTSPVCAVMRASLLTGVSSPTQGTHHMRNQARLSRDVKPYPVLMREAGYYATNPGKTDYQGLGGLELWNGSPTSYLSRPDKTKPFLHVENFNGTHESQGGGDIGSFDPSKLPLPPYYPDTEKVRRVWAGHFQTIAKLDAWVGQRLAELEASGEAENTLVFFYSDHGSGLPRAKRWLYDSGLRIPLIIRIPARFRRPGLDVPGSVSDELVSSLDLAPTLLALARAPIPAYMQGRSFLSVVPAAPRSHIHASRDRMDERFDIKRAVSDGRFKYIRNYEWFKPRQQFNTYPETNAWSGIMEEIRRLHDAQPEPAQVAWYFRFQPVEELYDTEADPHEMENLVFKPEQRGRLLALRAAHLKWRKESRDLGALPEGLILKLRGGTGAEYDLGLRIGEDLDSAWAALDSLPWKTVPELIDMARSRRPAVRYWALIGLGNYGAVTPDSKTALERALPDSLPWVAVAAARGLLMAGGNAGALQALVAFLKHDDYTVRLAAALALDEAGSLARAALPALQSAAQDASVDFRNVATRAISTLGDAPELPRPLIKGCPEPASPEYRPDRGLDDVRLCAGTSLHSGRQARESRSGIVLWKGRGGFVRPNAKTREGEAWFDAAGRGLAKLRSAAGMGKTGGLP